MNPLEMTSKILLILDLDETLIFATKEATDRIPDFECLGYHVFQRPGLHDFLIQCHTYFHIAIWSSASDRYVSEMAKRILPDSIQSVFIWGQSRHTLKNRGSEEAKFPIIPGVKYYIKRLKKIKKMGFSLERTLIIDDSPLNSVENSGNAINIIPFLGNAQDKELTLLLKFLMEIKDAMDVRKLEKRGWQTTLYFL